MPKFPLRRGERKAQTYANACCKQLALSVTREAEGVYGGVIGADIDHAVNNCRGGFNNRTSGVAPQLCPSRGVKRIDVVISAAEIDDPVRHCRGREYKIAGVVAPQLSAGRGVYRIHIAVPGAN